MRARRLQDAFFRPKDIVDLERLLALQPDLDRSYVREHLVEMVGQEDPRVRRWDELVALKSES
ncbi:MAG: hypothetical protein H5U40_05445 [Polyangiaceae bacterium]|nr:hypothetical protein [Polyangiaceae bacterium]